MSLYGLIFGFLTPKFDILIVVVASSESNIETRMFPLYFLCAAPIDWIANMLFPLPGFPTITPIVPIANPPPKIASTKSIPVGIVSLTPVSDLISVLSSRKLLNSIYKSCVF